LDFFNSQYLKKEDEKSLFTKLMDYLLKYDSEFGDLINTFPEEYNKKIFGELKSRIKNFSEYKQYTSFFYNDSSLPSDELIINQKMKITDLDIVKKALNLSLQLLKDK